MSLVSDVRKIVRKETEKIVNGKLPPATEKTPLEGGVGKGLAAIGEDSIGSGGLTPPFVETDISKRTYYDEQILTSSDGVFTWVVQPIKKIEMSDNDNTLVPFNYAEKMF